MKIFLIRYAQSFANVSNVATKFNTEITDIGFIQAIRIAKLFSNKKIDVFFSSCQKRASQTLDIINKEFKRKAEIIYDDLLVERKKGIYSGKNRKSMEKSAKDSKLDLYNFRPENGENYEDVFNRATEFKKKLFCFVREKNYQEIVIISHNAFISCFICALLNKSWKECYYFGVKNTSVSWFEFDSNFIIKDYEISTMTHILKFA
jgi:probable phosphoglycerate mutase